jgi:hypothetical protein
MCAQKSSHPIERRHVFRSLCTPAPIQPKLEASLSRRLRRPRLPRQDAPLSGRLAGDRDLPEPGRGAVHLTAPARRQNTLQKPIGSDGVYLPPASKNATDAGDD